MKIGIGIDTGGTCTDAVIYRFDDRMILASAKTATTKDDLSKGIAEALCSLPRVFLDQSDMIALSTTLATNACVENKGGRAKLILFGVNPENVVRSGAEYGLSLDDSLVFIDSKTRPDGQIVREPNWEQFRQQIKENLNQCDAVGIVEMFAKKSGSVLEKRAKKIIEEELPIPVVCGHQLFAENNILKRGASTLLNARLISVIEEFTQAVKRALERLHINLPFVIVRSDGSLMTETFAKQHPVETLLCGPVASVMGAMELTREENCIVVDIGGTTTDIAFVKEGTPRQAEQGVQIGSWNTFVKGLFVDTAALGGDSGVRLDDERRICLEEEKVMPLCMAASAFPSLKETLEKLYEDRSLLLSQKDDIYLGIKDISADSRYTELEREIAELFYQQPMTLGKAGDRLQQTLLRKHLARLIREGVLLRCGITPTDAMHVLGDFNQYDELASQYGAAKFARIRRESVDSFCREIYQAVKKKLYFHLVRVLIEERDPRIRNLHADGALTVLIEDTYEDALTESERAFLKFGVQTDAVLAGVGAPTHIFLPDVGKMLGTRVVTPAYAKAANALGAIVGNVSAKAVIEVFLNGSDGSYTVCGCGERRIMTSLEEAKAAAAGIAREKARQGALERGAAEPVNIQLDEKEEIVKTDFGPVFMGYKASATAKGSISFQSQRPER